MRVGGGFCAGSEEAVDGIMPSGFAAVTGAMGAFLWMVIGAILRTSRCVSGLGDVECCLEALI